MTTTSGTTDGISPERFHEAEGTADWRVVGDGATAFYPTGSLAASARFAAAIGDLAEIEDHPPDVDIRSGGVTLRILTKANDWYGPTERDVDTARRISELARSQGLVADPSQVQSLLVIPGAPDAAAIMPFWRAVLGYMPRPDSPGEDLVDANDRGPGFWFEAMDEPRGDGGGAIHIAIWVPPEQAETRVKSALAAGGRLIRDDHAPSWWTLADAAGNEADIATVLRRD